MHCQTLTAHTKYIVCKILLLLTYLFTYLLLTYLLIYLLLLTVCSTHKAVNLVAARTVCLQLIGYNYPLQQSRFQSICLFVCLLFVRLFVCCLFVCLFVLSVCLSVYPQCNSKTNDPKVFKLGVGNDIGISCK